MVIFQLVQNNNLLQWAHGLLCFAYPSCVVVTTLNSRSTLRMKDTEMKIMEKAALNMGPKFWQF